MRERCLARLAQHAWRIGAVLALVFAPSCAARVELPPAVTAARFPDFVFPAVPADLRGEGLASEHQLAWQWLQAGDPRNAEKSFAALLKKSPTFYPAEAGLGFVDLAGQRYDNAVARFDRVLNRSQAYSPALVGRGEALLALGRDQEALGSFEAALAADASLELPRRRVEVLQFRLLQASLAHARQAAEAGRFDEAIAAYEQAIVASPQSAFLYREIGVLERKSGRTDAALGHYRTAVNLDQNDALAWSDIGEILEARQEYAAAMEAYTQAYRLEPSAAVQERLGTLEAKLALARLPVEYRRIPESATITRGELAALIAIRFERLLEAVPTQVAVVVTDARDHWAASWIFTVTRAGIMDTYPNHTFQPSGVVRRSDLARSVSQLLDLIAQQRPALAQTWQTARRPISDVGVGHLNYPAVSQAVASGVMPLLDGSTFQLSRLVSGPEAIAVLDRVQAIVP